MLESSVSHFFDCSCKFGGGCNGFEQWRELRSSWLPALLHPPSRPPHSNDQHLSCRHLSRLDLRLAKGEIAEPSWENPHLRVLQQRGLEHEKAYIESLRSKSKGLAIVDHLPSR